MFEFEERQRFRQWWLMLLLAVTAVAGWSPLVLLLSDDDGSTDPVWVLLIVSVVAGAALPGWLLYLQLHVGIDGEGVHVRFRGAFVNRRIGHDEIESFEALAYRPIAEYGGWGIRWRGKGKIGYSVSGKEGVRMQLNNGKEVLIGSQRAEEMAAALAVRARR